MIHIKKFFFKVRTAHVINSTCEHNTADNGSDQAWSRPQTITVHPLTGLKNRQQGRGKN